jgi:hypothetical protein
MKFSTTTWLIIAGVAGLGIYYLTKKPNTKPVTEEELASMRREASLATNDQLLRGLPQAKNLLLEITSNHQKLITKYGEEGYANIFARASALVGIFEQEIVKRKIRIS